MSYLEYLDTKEENQRQDAIRTREAVDNYNGEDWLCGMEKRWVMGPLNLQSESKRELRINDLLGDPLVSEEVLKTLNKLGNYRERHPHELDFTIDLDKKEGK